jgi:acyl-CoA synthetase (AMP-forming)/AMP-acid ligase II
MTGDGRATAPDFLAAHGLVRRTGRAVPGGPPTVAALVDAAVDAHGDATAVATRDTRVSFRELREAVDRAADVLAATGVGPLDRVAVSLPNSVDVVVAFLAVMRLGAVWVGVNTNLAPPEQRFLVDDSGALTFVTTTAAAASGPPSPAVRRLLAVDPARPGAWWADGRAEPHPVEHLDPFGPAAIAYTSGTTGRPKGVVHSQHNVLVAATAVARSHPGPLVQGVCFPLTILNMQVLATTHSLVTGGTCVPMDRIDALGVAAWVADLGVQRMYGPPPLAYDLSTRPDVDPADLAALEDLIVGGAKVLAGLRERWEARFGRDFRPSYGLTEAPTVVTGGSTLGGGEAEGSSGRAKEHVRVTIRDETGAVLGPGEEGEICVGPSETGPLAGCYTPMLGYWDRPDATEVALRDGVLHTGDAGRLDDDGFLWVLDRRSDLILRGGANVYPAEVERVVEALPGVAEVAVVPRDHPRLGQEVVAVVLPATGTAGAALTRDALVAACGGYLARYKVPVDWYVVDAFPRNAMGKVRKPLLRDWLGDGSWTEPEAPPRPLP